MRQTWVLILIIGACSTGVLSGQQSTAGLEVGPHFGFSFGGDSDEPIEERLGIQVLIPIAGPVSIGASLARFFTFPDVSDPAVTGSAWRTIVTVRVTPFGPASVASVGLGFTTARFHREDPGMPALTWWDTLGAAVVRVHAPFRRVRPFAELYVFGPDTYALSVLLGINVLVL